MEPEDLLAVEEIECQTLTPWSPLALRCEMNIEQGMTLVALAEDFHVIGWCACRWIWPEAELLKITVAGKERKRGVGSALFQHLLSVLRDQKFAALFLEVRACNNEAVSFYNKHGFREVGKRHAYYCDPKDDALILRKDIC